MTTNDPSPPDDDLEELKRQLVRAIADAHEARLSAAGFKSFSDKRDYTRQAAFYERRADELERRIAIRYRDSKSPAGED